jgi:hypothetical protein
MANSYAAKPATAGAVNRLQECDRLGGAIGTSNTLLNRTKQAVRADLVGSDHCAALGVSAHSLLELCRKLVADGHDPAMPIEAWRGDVLCLCARSIGEAARLRVATHGVGFERLPGCTAGPPVRQTGRRDP